MSENRSSEAPEVATLLNQPRWKWVLFLVGSAIAVWATFDLRPGYEGIGTATIGVMMLVIASIMLRRELRASESLLSGLPYLSVWGIALVLAVLLLANTFSSHPLSAESHTVLVNPLRGNTVESDALDGITFHKPWLVRAEVDREHVDFAAKTVETASGYRFGSIRLPMELRAECAPQVVQKGALSRGKLPNYFVARLPESSLSARLAQALSSSEPVALPGLISKSATAGVPGVAADCLLPSPSEWQEFHKLELTVANDVAMITGRIDVIRGTKSAHAAFTIEPWAYASPTLLADVDLSQLARIVAPVLVARLSSADPRPYGPTRPRAEISRVAGHVAEWNINAAIIRETSFRVVARITDFSLAE